MRRVIATLLAWGLLSGEAVLGEAAAGYFPPPEAEGGWRSLVPPNAEPTEAQKKAVREEAGFDWEELRAAWDYCRGLGSPHSLLVIRHGWIAGEWLDFTEPRGIASCTKSLTALALAKLLDLSDAGKLGKRIGLDDEAWRFLPARWSEGEEVRKRIQIHHLLTMTSGLTPYDGPYREGYLEKVFAQAVEAPPGRVWAYASVPVDLLSLIVEDVAGRSLGDFFNEEIGAPIRAAPVRWGTFAGHTGGSGGPQGGARFPARDLARVGYLVLHGGTWERDGRAVQVISAERVAAFTRPAASIEGATWRQPNFAFEPDANRYYGRLWWSNRTGQALGPAAPRDVVYMSGWGKQACFVVPSLDMVVVRLGGNAALNARPDFYHGLWSRLMAAVLDPPPPPLPRRPPLPLSVELWDTCELAFESSKEHRNPFRDVELTAAFTHAATGKTVVAGGFHDGDRTWRVRFLPLETGEWRYATRSSDPELDARTGTLRCVAPAKPYLRGPLRADALGFVHSDGTRPFLVSTRLSCQLAPPEVRQKAIRFLRESGITRVLFVLGGVPGTVKDLFAPGPDFTRYDVGRFRAIDGFIDELRRGGMIASPYFYYFNDGIQRAMTPEDDRAFLRYGMARFGAYANVLPVLANEVEQKLTDRRSERYDLASHAWANELGAELKRLAVFGVPVTVHNPMETERAVRPGFYSLLRDWPFPWADCMLRQLQVGALGGVPELGDDVPEARTPVFDDRAFARHNELLIDLRRFGVPVVNEEPGYEMLGRSWDSRRLEPRPWNSQTPETLRATFWTAAMAGASAAWGSPATYELGDPLPGISGSATPGYLKVLAGVMESLPWWKMAPENAAVSPESVITAVAAAGGVPWRTSFALAGPGGCCLAYSLHGGPLQIEVAPAGAKGAGGDGAWSVARIDQRTGERVNLATAASGPIRLQLPEGHDWAILVERSPGPPFRLERDGHAWWLRRPDGSRFFSLGACVVDRGAAESELETGRPAYSARRHYPSAGAWADATLERLRAWGFTTIGAWSDYGPLLAAEDRGFCATPELHAGATAGAPWWDLWSEVVVRRVRQAAREGIVPVRRDGRVLGYYTDNELGWWCAALFKMTLEAPPHGGHRQRLLRLLRDRYRDDWQALLEDFDPEGAASFGDLERGGVLYLRPGKDGMRVLRRFLALTAEQYYELVHDTVRELDGRALILGDRYQSFYYPEVAQAAARHVDAISTNLNAHWDDGTFCRFYLETLHALVGKPVLVSEIYVAATENRSGNPNSKGLFPVVPTQRERAEAFRTTLEALARTPCVVGADWFQYYDEPPGGRSDGEDYDFGLVDIHDAPYEELTRAAAGLDLVGLKSSPPRERPDAAAGVPRAPPDAFADFKPMLALKRWDRERGFVRPSSPLPLADLYASWDGGALYLGLYALDPVEAVCYRDGRVPEEDRLEWTVELAGRATPIRLRLGAGRDPGGVEEGIAVKSVSGTGLDVRNIAALRLPARAMGRERLRAGETLRLSSTVVTHARAHRMEWACELTLAE
ncbi:MAG: serine hydrolase [Planctomycetes bacterium]|nr:serine hydrolase [Planctomycetota bacterium]